MAEPRDQFYERRELIEELRRVFVGHGFLSLSDVDLDRIALFKTFIFDEVLVQDTGSTRDGRIDTRKPVEELLDALERVWDLYEECERVAEFEVAPHRLNVARTFIDIIQFGDADCIPNVFGSETQQLHHAAGLALESGILPKKNERNHAYDRFIRCVRGACGATLPRDRASFVSLLYDCEFVLPKMLRSSNKASAGDRVDSFLKRRAL